MKILAAVLIALLAALMLLGWISSSVATASQSQATIEAARAAQIASAAQASTAFGNTILIGLFVLFACLAAVLVAFLLRRISRLEAALRSELPPSQTASKWLSGPNAHWARSPSQLPAQSMPELIQTMLLMQLIQSQPRPLPPIAPQQPNSQQLAGQPAQPQLPTWGGW